MVIQLWYTNTGTPTLDAGWYLDVYMIDDDEQILLCREYMSCFTKPKGVPLYLAVKKLINQHNVYFANKNKIFYGYY